MIINLLPKAANLKPILMVLATMFLTMALPQSANAERTKLAAALIDEQVLLTSSFSGTKVTIFGAVEGDTNDKPEIVILVRGPDRPAWISKKSKVLGLWLGHSRVFFDAAPTFFGTASTDRIEKIAPMDTLNLYGLTAQSQISIDKKHESSPNAADLEKSFIDKRTRQGLYVSSPHGVSFEGGGLFRADVKMPDLTPPGLYTVKVMLFRNGRPVDSTLQTFVVTKVGMERTIFTFATKHKVIYAFFGVILALGAGFISSRVFRMMQH